MAFQDSWSGYTPWQAAGASVNLSPMLKPNKQPKQKTMKSNYQLAITMVAGVILATGTSLWAADADNSTSPPPAMAASNSNDQGQATNPGQLFRGNELSLDGFATGSDGSYTIDHISTQRIRKNTQGGAGVGLNYFFTRYVGIGADAYSENTTGTFIDNASGNLILRLPLGESGFAPYAFGGGGHQFNAAKLSFAQGGAGIEYRFCQHVGVFIDARCVWPNEAKYYGVGRAGLRFAF
jgi:hypothetical protein